MAALDARGANPLILEDVTDAEQWRGSSEMPDFRSTAPQGQ